MEAKGVVLPSEAPSQFPVPRLGRAQPAPVPAQRAWRRCVSGAVRAGALPVQDLLAGADAPLLRAPLRGTAQGRGQPGGPQAKGLPAETRQAQGRNSGAPGESYRRALKPPAARGVSSALSLSAWRRSVLPRHGLRSGSRLPALAPAGQAAAVRGGARKVPSAPLGAVPQRASPQNHVARTSVFHCKRPLITVSLPRPQLEEEAAQRQSKGPWTNTVGHLRSD